MCGGHAVLRASLTNLLCGHGPRCHSTWGGVEEGVALVALVAVRSAGKLPFHLGGPALSTGRCGTVVLSVQGLLHLLVLVVVWK